MRTALVTGASSGIGREVARLLADEGYTLFLVARTEERLRPVADALSGSIMVPADLRDPAAPEAIAAAVGEVDVLVNNAGVGAHGPVAEMDLDVLTGMVQVNVTALTALTRLFLPGMLRRDHGRILNVASTAAFQPGPHMATYYATKAYVLSFTEALVEELRGSRVTATALCPGPTATGFQAAAGTEISPLVAGRRLPSAAEVAEAGVRGMHRGDAIVVPGAVNKVLAAGVRAVPRPLVRRAVRRLQESKPSADPEAGGERRQGSG